MAVALPGPSGSSCRKTNVKAMLAVNRVGPVVNKLAGGGPWSSQVWNCHSGQHMTQLSSPTSKSPREGTVRPGCGFAYFVLGVPHPAEPQFPAIQWRGWKRGSLRSLPTPTGVVLGSSLPDTSPRCQVRGSHVGLCPSWPPSWSSQATPTQLGWKKTHSSPIPVPGRPWPSSVAPAPGQLVPQLEQTKVPEKRNHSCS